jgi:hypothetical protein
MRLHPLQKLNNLWLSKVMSELGTDHQVRRSLGCIVKNICRHPLNPALRSRRFRRDHRGIRVQIQPRQLHIDASFLCPALDPPQPIPVPATRIENAQRPFPDPLGKRHSIQELEQWPIRQRPSITPRNILEASPQYIPAARFVH